MNKTKTDSLNKLVERIKETLKQPMTFHMLVNELKLPEKDVEEACRHMICETEEMEDVNAWLRLTPPRKTITLDEDDLDWLRGTGRFAQ